MTATATLDGEAAVATGTLPISLSPQVDAPILTLAPASGVEDGSVALDLSAALVDPAAGESLSVTLSGVPAGATLSAGEVVGVEEDGLTVWMLLPEDLDGLTLTLPTDFVGEFDLAVEAVASDLTGDSAGTSASLPVTVVATEPTIPGPSEIVELAALTMDEDVAVALDLLGAFSDAADLTNVSGATISGLTPGTSLSAGELQADGSYVLSASDFEGLMLTPAADSDADMRISVVAELSGGELVTGAFDLEVEAVADLPTVTITGASSDDPSAIAFGIGGGLTDLDGSETLTRFVSGLPEGARLSAGVYAGDGLWALEADDLDGLTLRPPTDFYGSFTFTTTAVSQESANGDLAIFDRTVTATVSGGEEGDSWTNPDARGDEDSTIALGEQFLVLDLLGLTQVKILNVPEGGSLSAGYVNGSGAWFVPASELETLTYTPPEHDATDVTLAVYKLFTFLPPVLIGQIDVQIDAVADAPTLSASVADGAEDQALALDISGSLVDLDGSEGLSFAVVGLPEGAVLSAGLRDPASGTWLLKASDLPGLTLTPPEDFSGTLTFEVRAIALEAEGDEAVVSQTLSLEVSPLTDGVSLTTLAATGSEDQPISLSISLTELDADGSETVTALTISGVPDGAVLSAGTDLGGGVYELDPADLAGLTILPPPEYSGTFELVVSAAVADGAAAPTVATAALQVTAEPVSDAPVIAQSVGAWTSATEVDLDIDVSTVATDGSEILTVVLRGMPEGATLSSGTNSGDGAWVLDADALDGLQMVLPQDWAGAVSLTVDAYARVAGTGDVAHSSAAVDMPDSPPMAPLSASFDAGTPMAPLSASFEESGETNLFVLEPDEGTTREGENIFADLALVSDDAALADDAAGAELAEGAAAPAEPAWISTPLAPDFALSDGATASRIVIELEPDALFPDDALTLSQDDVDPALAEALEQGTIGLRLDADGRRATLEGDAEAELFVDLVRGMALQSDADQGERRVSIDVYDADGAFAPLESVDLALRPGEADAILDPGDLSSLDGADATQVESLESSVDWTVPSLDCDDLDQNSCDLVAV